MKRIIVLGGGFGGVAAVQRLDRIFRHDDSVEILLVSNTNYLNYTPMLADVAGGTIEPRHAVPALRVFLKKARLGVATVTGIDLERQTVQGNLIDGGRAETSYDYLVIALGAVTNSGLNQNVVSASDLSNNELLARSRTIYVVSDSVFVKKADMEKYLLRQKELEEYRLHVVQSKQDADLILQIKRIPFTNSFPYSITDRVSSIVLMQGEIDAFPSKVPAQIATALAEKLKEANKKKTSN